MDLGLIFSKISSICTNDEIFSFAVLELEWIISCPCSQETNYLLKIVKSAIQPEKLCLISNPPPGLSWSCARTRVPDTLAKLSSLSSITPELSSVPLRKILTLSLLMITQTLCQLIRSFVDEYLTGKQDSDWQKMREFELWLRSRKSLGRDLKHLQTVLTHMKIVVIGYSAEAE